MVILLLIGSCCLCLFPSTFFAVKARMCLSGELAGARVVRGIPEGPQGVRICREMPLGRRTVADRLPPASRQSREPRQGRANTAGPTRGRPHRVPRSGLDLLAPCGACTARSLLFGV